MDDLRDAEVEELHAALIQHEDVGGLHVAVRDALLVRERQRFGGGAQELEDLFEATRRDAGLALLDEDVVERLSLEPLEDHVGDGVAAGQREHADVSRLADRSGSFGEVGEEATFLNEVVEELLALLLCDVTERLEDFDGDGPLPEQVLRAIDDRESTFTDDGLDRVFLRDRRADQLQRVLHARRGFSHAYRNDFSEIDVTRGSDA